MLPWLGEDFGNPSSIHHWGQKARQAVEVARERVAELVDAADPSEIIFTSGATEANNWVIQSFSRACISPFEHSSVLQPSLARGCEISENDSWTIGCPMDGAVKLLSSLLVNNETGAFVDARQWFHQSALPVHRDLTQAAGKFVLHEHAYDLGTFSAHKFHGPKGAGVLHLRGSSLIEPLLIGGGQEGGMRAGTLNVPAIVGMGAAAAIAMDEMEADLALAQECRSILMEALARIPDSFVVEGVGQGVVQSPYILSCCFAGLYAEPLVIELDARGYGISSGAACSSETTEPSHVLRALGLPDDLIRGAARFSFGRFSSREGAQGLASLLPKVVEDVRSLGRT